MTLKSNLFSLKTLIPLWLVAFALIATFAPPMSPTARGLLVMVAVVVSAVVFLLRKDRPSTVAEVLNRVERSSSTVTIHSRVSPSSD